MDSLRLQNYRCFADTGTIYIKPLNFFVGANSSGKSSFLKFFPLLKQSIGVKRKGVFLWLSNDVDFKDFNNVVKDKEEYIEIDFSIKDIMPYVNAYDKKDHVKVNVSLRIASNTDKFDYLNQLELTFLDQKIAIQLDRDGIGQILINNKDVFFEKQEKVRTFSTLSLLPILIYENEETDFEYMSPFYHKIIEKILNNKKGDVSDLYNRIKGKVKLDSQEELKSFIKSSIADDDGNVPYSLEVLNTAYLMTHLAELMAAVNQYINVFTSSINYIRPLRATTERYYRFQNYAIDEIDSDGKNLAMFIYNLPEHKLREFNDWTRELFGFDVIAEPSEGHIQLMIKEVGKPNRNMIDVGFGYTQILPTISIIWNALYQRKGIMFSRRSVPMLVVMEQPELHLHPRMQGLFADMLVKVVQDAKKKNVDLRIIIETHSETIINRIGEAISKDQFDKEDVNVYLFNAQNEGFDKSIETSNYSSDGYLINWPYGFFSDYVY